MSAVACNPVTGAKGKVLPSIYSHNDAFSEQVSQALAIKLNLKTAQHANEKALGHLLQSDTYNGELKQTLQARSAVYGTQLDPSWFTKNYGLSVKIKSLRERRIARSMLAGAPVFLAQLNIHKT